MDKAICDCYEEKSVWRYRYEPILRRTLSKKVTISICNGTREREECYCGGDRKKCDFYKEVRNGR